MQQHASGDDSLNGHRPQVYGQPTVSNPHKRPPSPPIDPQLFDTRVQSPTTSSNSSPFASTAIHSADSHRPRPPPPPGHPAIGRPPPGQLPYQNSPYADPPPAHPSYSYPAPAIPLQPPMYNQRPLPSTFPPGDQSGNTNPSESNSASPIDPNTPNQ